jgi:ABC-2 type transport system permease protein
MIAPYAVTDSLTMLRRNLRHLRRYPSMTAALLLQPLALLLLFVYVFGETLGTGLPGAFEGGRGAYLSYVVPGILVVTVTSAALGTAISVATDRTERIVARFRTMGISRSSVLSGHVLGTLVQTLVLLAILLAVAVLMGFRATTGVSQWLAAAALLLFVTVAFTWLCVALGLLARSVETASNTPLLLTMLVFMGSGFVPVESFPPGLRWFAEHQPFTPITETLRGLLGGTPIGSSGLVALGWCVFITCVGYLWSRSLYDREPEPIAV